MKKIAIISALLFVSCTFVTPCFAASQTLTGSGVGGTANNILSDGHTGGQGASAMTVGLSPSSQGVYVPDGTGQNFSLQIGSAKGSKQYGTSSFSSNVYWQDITGSISNGVWTPSGAPTTLTADPFTSWHILGGS
jgi:hypothetical protein